MDENRVKQIIKEEIKKNYTYGSPEIPPHQHDGVDNRRINQTDIIPNKKYFANLISSSSETFTIDAIQGFKQFQFYGYAANNVSAPATQRAIVNGNVQFGQCNTVGNANTLSTSSLFSLTNVSGNIIQTGNSIFTNTTGPAFRVGFSGGSGFGSSANKVYFVYVVDDSAAVVATATVTAYTNTSITITTTLASGWEITGGYVIT